MDSIEQHFIKGWETMHKLFNTEQKHDLPEVDDTRTQDITRFDPKTGKIQLGSWDDKPHIPNYVKTYMLGKSLSSALYQKLNPAIMQRLYVEGNEKYEESRKSLLGLEWSVVQEEYRKLIAIANGVIPTYAGLCFTEWHLDREQAAEMLEVVVHHITPVILGAGDDFETMACKGASDATRWFTAGAIWLPDIARITESKDYLTLFKKAYAEKSNLESI